MAFVGKLEGMMYFTQAYGQLRPRVSNRIELNRYIGKSKAINQIEKKGYQWHPYK